MTYDEVLKKYSCKNRSIRFSINGNFCCRPSLLRGHQFIFDHSYIAPCCDGLSCSKLPDIEVFIFTSIS